MRSSWTEPATARYIPRYITAMTGFPSARGLGELYDMEETIKVIGLFPGLQGPRGRNGLTKKSASELWKNVANN